MPSSTPSNADRRALWQQWGAAAKTPEIDKALRKFYADLDDAVTKAPGGKPVCNASGRCCKFTSYDHLLYVTGLEIAWFLGQVGTRPPADKPASDTLSLTQLPDACRYQVDGLCSTHDVRPLGCRVYFCQAGTEAWQQDVYEAFLNRLIELHKSHGLDYRYMEWRGGLIEADEFLA